MQDNIPTNPSDGASQRVGFAPGNLNVKWICGSQSPRHKTDPPESLLREEADEGATDA